VLDHFDLEIKEIIVDNFTISDATISSLHAISEDDVYLMKDMFTHLKRRLTQE